jgi:exopolyphosphatase/guanosine-5'-triphosphate,3'-diphosphate pyrophosphatase
MVADPAERTLRPSAVVDIGSNSIRLVVFRDRSRAPVAVFNERVICGIGTDLARTGRLHEKGVARALANLPRFAAIARSMDIADTALLATAATREAEDGPAFLKQIEDMFDRPVQQLDGEEEARLAAAGVVCGLPDAKGIVADLGGGSLELAALADGEVSSFVTLPLGPLRLLATVGDDRAKVGRSVDDALADIEWLPRAAADGSIYIVGGAWRALARLHMVQTGYPLRVIHNYQISAREAAEFCDVIAGLGASSLLGIEAVSKSRAKSLPIAAAVLQRLIVGSGADNIVFSALGIREGKAFDALDSEAKAEDPLIVACEEMANRESRFPGVGSALFDWVTPLFADDSTAEKRLRQAACLLGDIGWHEHPDYRAEQVYFRILRLPLLALGHADKTRIALAVYRRYGGSMNDQALRTAEALLSEVDIAWSRRLGAALRLAETLTAGHARLLDGASLSLSGDTLTLNMRDGHAELVGDVVRARFGALAREFGRTAKIEGLGED